MPRILLLFLSLALLPFTACDRNETVRDARETNRELATSDDDTSPVSANDDDAPNLDRARSITIANDDNAPARRSVNPIRHMTQEERNSALMEAESRKVADRAIAFMETRIDLSEEQKEKVYAIAAETKLEGLSAAERKAALKALRKRVKTEVLEGTQTRQFRRDRQ